MVYEYCLGNNFIFKSSLSTKKCNMLHVSVFNIIHSIAEFDSFMIVIIIMDTYNNNYD